MSNAKFVLLFLVIVMIGGFCYVYFFYEKPMQENITYSNITVYAYYNNERIETNYIIETLYGKVNGSTYKDTASIISIPLNNSFEIYNVGNDYYKKILSYDNLILKNYRVNLNLTKAGNLSFKHFGNFGVEKNISLNVINDGVFNDANVCLKWSLHVLQVKIENYTLINADDFYKDSNFDKCFKYGDFNDTVVFNVYYDFFSKINDDDYIKISIIDEINNTMNYTIKKGNYLIE
jgi:hypothetical protein